MQTQTTVSKICEKIKTLIHELSRGVLMLVTETWFPIAKLC